MRPARSRRGDFRAFAAATAQRAPRQPEWYADDNHPVSTSLGTKPSRIASGWADGCRPNGMEHAARGGLDGRLFPWGTSSLRQAVARPNLRGERRLYSACRLFPAKDTVPRHGPKRVGGDQASEHHPSLSSEPNRGGRECSQSKAVCWDNSVRRLRRLGAGCVISPGTTQSVRRVPMCSSRPDEEDYPTRHPPSPQ